MGEIPLIVGAGPTGLAAALLLARHSIQTRIIDAAAAPSPYSRALAVNPRTLDLLGPSGVTARMLERGMRIAHVHLYHEGRQLAELSLSKIPHRYPFMLALSQAATESLLTDTLKQHGVEVERGTKLTACRQTDTPEATLETPTGVQTLRPRWLLGADGARSKAREQLGLGFDGSSFPEMWHLFDVPLSGTLQQDAVHVTFFDDGKFLFMMRVVDDVRKPAHGDPVWRVLGNFPELFERLPSGTRPSGAALWQSQFHISHRIASQLSAGNVYLAGDAAHIHSPMGARGMNLGIEDAWTFAELMKAGKPERYSEICRRIDARVVKRVEFMSRIVMAHGPLTRWVRRTLVPLLPRIPLLFKLMSNTADRLDHDVEL